jgi:uncharacterized protein YndB with AHSA1/START domain
MEVLMSSELRFEQTIDAEPGEVYRMFTNSTAMRDWLADRVSANPAPGGYLYLWWQSGYYTAGWYTHLEQPNLVAFTLQGRGEPGASQVEVRIEPWEGKTHITLLHRGLREASQGEDTRLEIQKGWRLAFERLTNALENGADLRITTRPMLGLLFGLFSPDAAKELGVPVSAGMLLSGVVDGLGAQKAGMQKDDVIVAINGKPVASYNEVAGVMHGKKAGDVVHVTYYRGSQKHEAEMTLSPRPLPEVPTTVAGLAEALKHVYHGEMAELEEVLQGVTEEEASYKPAEKEWSVKEALAHLLQGERSYQDYVTDLFLSNEKVADGYGNNVEAYIKATVNTYRTAQALEDAFHASRVETIALIANLPEDFARHKSTFWRLGYQALAFPFHVHDHAEQMKSAVAAARAKAAGG